jgi:membrane-bound lytic murein transglycosylase D
MLAGCATTSPTQQFRSFFLPPAPPAAAPAEALPEPPPLLAAFYASEAPSLGNTAPLIPRPTDGEFLIKRAEERFAAGKRAIQDGRTDDARREFNRAVEILMSAPDDIAERPRMEQRLEEMVDSIYRYDAGDLGAGRGSEPDPDQPKYDKRPIDEILELTFPVDPALRNKVREQIQATQSQLPLQESDAVVSFINFFSSPRGKKILESGLRRSGRYKAMIERVLAEEGLPQELIFVAQAESGFQPHAVSNKLCVGLWQFAKFRGQEYGLDVNSSFDLRMDPELATRAAARHLHDLYTHLGDWYLALAAYDCGPLCIDRAVQRTGYADFWALRRMGVLPARETENYVPAILAMIIVSKNAKDYGLDDIAFDPPLEYDSMELEAPTSLALAATAVDSTVSELRDLNPALLKGIAPAGYRLHVPKGTLDRLEEALAVVPVNRRDSWRMQRVESGDTLASLAKHYGATAESLAAANRDALPDVGQFVAIPVAFPGDRPAKRTIARKTSGTSKKLAVARASTSRSPASHKQATSEQKGSAQKTTAQKTSSKSPARRAPGA